MGAPGVADLERRLRDALERRDGAGAARALLALGQTYARAGDPARAAPCFERAAGLEGAPLETVRAAAAALGDLVRAGCPGPPASAPAPPAPRLRRALEAARRLAAAAADLPRVLDAILDEAIDLAGAERGFVALRGPAGLVLRAGRDLTGTALGEGDLVVSRSLLDLALRRRAPVIAADAARDRRFRTIASIRALRVRSVLAVPIAAGGEPLGAIYLDHRLKSRAFGPEDADLVALFAAQAALALERTFAADEARSLRAAREAEGPSTGTGTGTETSPGTGAATETGAFEGMVGRSAAMRTVFRTIERVAASDLSVFIHGETGTGKELVARAVHARSERRAGPFVAESCAALAESLLESELFGHERGAFTGAVAARAGLVERAHGGTLFLDEVGEMPAALQSKLLRVLQEREVRRIGSGTPRRVDVRVVAASNRDLRELVAGGKFRQDLFYRLHVVRIDLPPLRDRREDILPLAQLFLSRLAGGAGDAPRLVPAARRLLVEHDWPGNVRELENALRRAALLAGRGPIEPPHLGTGAPDPGAPSGDAEATRAAAASVLAERRRAGARAGLAVERAFLERALAAADGNVSRAARSAGISRATLHRMLARHGMRGRGKRV